MVTEQDLLKLLQGQKVIVTSCEAREHGDNPGCLCHLKGQKVKLGKPYETVFAGTPTWHIKGLKQRVRLSEITLCP